eukprot:357801-Chlamydomonas_euryale.AAC.2
MSSERSAVSPHSPPGTSAIALPASRSSRSAPQSPRSAARAASPPVSGASPARVQPRSSEASTGSAASARGSSMSGLLGASSATNEAGSASGNDRRWHAATCSVCSRVRPPIGGSAPRRTCAQVQTRRIATGSSGVRTTATGCACVVFFSLSRIPREAISLSPACLPGWAELQWRCSLAHDHPDIATTLAPRGSKRRVHTPS